MKKAGSITVTPRIYPLFQLVQSEAWPPMMEKYLKFKPGSYATFKPTAPGQIPPRRSRAVVIEPSTPSNDQGPATCHPSSQSTCKLMRKMFRIRRLTVRPSSRPLVPSRKKSCFVRYCFVRWPLVPSRKKSCFVRYNNNLAI